MKKEVILSGFGGQGVMSIGKNLVEAAVEEDLEASWVPSYGPEMRGGTANCTVIISDGRIGAPLVERPSEAMPGAGARRSWATPRWPTWSCWGPTSPPRGC